MVQNFIILYLEAQLEKSRTGSTEQTVSAKGPTADGKLPRLWLIFFPFSCKINSILAVSLFHTGAGTASVSETGRKLLPGTTI